MIVIKKNKDRWLYIDKKINRLLGEKEIQGLYDGLSGKRNDQEDYNYRESMFSLNFVSVFLASARSKNIVSGSNTFAVNGFWLVF